MNSRPPLIAIAILIAGVLFALPATALAQISFDAIAADDSPIDGSGINSEPPFWATWEGLGPDPERPGQTMADDHFRGNPRAPIAVVEFSDYRCPASRSHNQQTQPVLDARFVETDQVFWVFKHFPLSTNRQAKLPAAAAECAAEQGKFWEMHDLLFDETETWVVDDPTPALTALAQQLQLDTSAFATCLADEQTMAQVDSDRADGIEYLIGVPTFFVIYDDQVNRISGTLPAETFSERLQEIINSRDVHSSKIFLPLLQG